ncbi:probable UDP-N-acetylglucosamine--peptide N-acetylglucosaminyltransferase SPINDLY isoform X2, partial [Tanacetum coccineum]
MENLNYTEELPISQSATCSPAVNPLLHTSNVHGLPESTIVCVCMESLDTNLINANRRSGQVAITIEDAHQDTPQVPFHTANLTPEQAEWLGNRALYYNWHYADAMYNLGVAYSAMLKFEMEIVFYGLAFHFNPHCAEAYNNLGVIYKDRDNLDKTVECYQNLAFSIKPNFSQSLNNLGVVYTMQKGKMDVASSMIEKAIVANPTYAEAYNNLVVLYRDVGSISLAIESYEQCLKIDPDSRNMCQ